MPLALYRLLPALMVLGVVAPYAYAQTRPASPPSSAPQTAQPPRTQNDPPPIVWWRDEQFKKEISLRDDQAKKIEAIWEKTSPTLRQKNDELMEAQRELSSQISKNLAEGRVFNQIKVVEIARADVATTRQIMLYQMRGILTPAQRTKFDDIHPRWQAEFDRQRAEWQKRRMAEQRPRSSNAKPDSKSEPRKPF